MKWFFCAFAFAWITASAAGSETIDPARIRTAVERSLKRIETGANNYAVNRTCFSCHHQLSISVFAEAKNRGFAVNRDLFFLQVEFTRETFRQKLGQVERGQGVGGANTTVAYALHVLEAAEQAPDDVTSALVQFLVIKQAKDGSWPAVTDRPPSEGSAFTNAALALRALKTYGASDATLPADLKGKIDESWKRGRDWVLSHEPKTLEDRVFHLEALVAASADRQMIAKHRLALQELQIDDGSWRQLPSLNGDAYATASAMRALVAAGLGTDSPVWQRGAEFLLRTQTEDGAWIVSTRSKPIQLFFDNGDPGGKSQFISMMSTSWATLALLQGLPKQP